MPPEVLARLVAQDVDLLLLVRRCVAENPSTPPKLLARLAQDPDPKVRGNAARNPSAPADLPALRAQDPDPKVHRGVARNRNAPTELIARVVAQDAGLDVDILKSVSWDPKTLLEDLE
jgi:nucleoid-associated protein YgaU